MMRTSRLLVLFAASVGFSGSLVAQAPALPAPPQIITTGTGEARVAPDRAMVLIGVQSKAASASQAAAQNARRQRAVLDTLRAIGIAGDQLSTSGYSVAPDMQYTPNQAPRVTGYTVTNTVNVDVRRIDDVGKVIDAALGKGANEISSLQFFSSKADSVRRAAMAVAVANARADAEVLARAAGGSLGQLLELSTSAPIRPMLAMAMSAGRVATPIEPGEETMSVSVTARWAFLAGR